jgi:AraC family transcriptional regulator, regulatory protein of adaptative response / DNA-3-methyladenine glycosylase II
MALNPDAAYRALASRDSRFDGVFFAGVRTTGIYCRPSCSARTPHRENVAFYPSSAAAQRAGFRACKRCRPDATPGSADWNVRADLAGRAVRLIADGVVDRDGISGLADRLGYSVRQVNRAVAAEMGAPPLALARAQRAQTARILLERTAMPAGDIAFAAGFSSIRQFNDTVQAVFASTPSQLRAARHNGRMHSRDGRQPGFIELRLPFRRPMTLARTLAHLSGRVVAGLESLGSGNYQRVLRLPHGPALVTISDGEDHVRVSLHLSDQRDLAAAVARIRRLLDLDADPVAVDGILSRQPALAALVTRHPGLRSPGSVDGIEMAVRALVGQQVSVAAARRVLGRMVAEFGEPVFTTDPPAEDAGWRLFPTAETLAALDPHMLPMPRTRGRCIVATAEAVASGRLSLDAGADRAETRRRLLEITGIGPWTADYVLMRAVGDPDVFLGSDLGIVHALRRLGGPGAIDADAAAPWRSYLTHQLWAELAMTTNDPSPVVPRKSSKNKEF